MLVLKSLLQCLKGILGIDKDIIWILINKAWSVVRGPINIYFLLAYLTPEEQGLWFTFISLGALSIFAELGFTTIITQFVSHEYAHIQTEKKFLVGNINNIDRLVSLVRYSLKLYSIVIPLAIFILCIVGFFYFNMKWDNTYYAWILYSIVGGLSLMSSLLQAIYQGLDRVKSTQINIIIGSLLMAFMNWALLYLHFAVWALALGNLFGLIVMLFLLYFTAPDFWKQIIHHKLISHYHWFNEIIKLQWRYAISWISGYFLFSLLIPAVYKFENSVLAGQLGATMSITNAINGIASAWVTAKIPKFNIMASSNKRMELLDLFSQLFRKSVYIFILLNIIFIILLYILNYYSYYNTRFLSLKLGLLLSFSQLPNLIIGLLSFYLRSHKLEPYYLLSALSALIIIFFVFIVLPKYGLEVFYYAIIFSQFFITMPISISIYRKYKNVILPNNFYS